MGLFSKNYNKDRISVHELKKYLEANAGGMMHATTCQDNGSTAVLVFDGVSEQWRIDYQRELSCTTISPYDMYYSGPLSGEQIKRLIVDGINMPSVRVDAARVGNAFTFGVSVQMNHRYFNYDEVNKNFERLGVALESAYRVLERKGIID